MAYIVIRCRTRATCGLRAASGCGVAAQRRRKNGMRLGFLVAIRLKLPILAPWAVRPHRTVGNNRCPHGTHTSIRCDEHVHASHIHLTYGLYRVCRTARTFVLNLEGRVRWQDNDRAVIRQPARAFGADWGPWLQILLPTLTVNTQSMDQLAQD